jgi:hypothetical protein
MENANLSLAEKVKIALDNAVKEGYSWASSTNKDITAIGLAFSDQYFGNQSMRILRGHIETWREEKNND